VGHFHQPGHLLQQAVVGRAAAKALRNDIHLTPNLGAPRVGVDYDAGRRANINVVARRRDGDRRARRERAVSVRFGGCRHALDLEGYAPLAEQTQQPADRAGEAQRVRAPAHQPRELQRVDQAAQQVRQDGVGGLAGLTRTDVHIRRALLVVQDDQRLHGDAPRTGKTQRCPGRRARGVVRQPHGWALHQHNAILLRGGHVPDQ